MRLDADDLNSMMAGEQDRDRKLKSQALSYQLTPKNVNELARKQKKSKPFGVGEQSRQIARI